MEHDYSLSHDEGRPVKTLVGRFLAPSNWCIIVLPLVINIFLFTLLPLVGQDDIRRGDLEAMVPVNLVRIERKPPPPPEEEQKKVPEKKPPPKELPTVKMKRHIPKNQEITLDIPRLDFEINPQLTWGMAVAAPETPVAAQETEGSCYGQGDVDQVPIPVLTVKPVYPYRARRLGITGNVKVSFMVDEHGQVSQVKIIEADPPGIFERSVLKTLPSWKFTPGKISDQTVATLFTTTIVFNLED